MFIFIQANRSFLLKLFPWCGFVCNQIGVYQTYCLPQLAEGANEPKSIRKIRLRQQNWMRDLGWKGTDLNNDLILSIFPVKSLQSLEAVRGRPQTEECGLCLSPLIKLKKMRCCWFFNELSVVRNSLMWKLERVITADTLQRQKLTQHSH